MSRSVIILPDAGHIQEEDALFANRHGFSKHKPALPLYTVRHAEQAMDLFKKASDAVESAVENVIPGQSK